jgi:CheY-like chemotaxis protein
MSPQPKTPNPPQAAHSAVVHVVDDHDLSRKHLRAVLGYHGYSVVLSEGAAQAAAYNATVDNHGTAAITARPAISASR